MQTSHSKLNPGTNPANLLDAYQTQLFPPSVVELYRVVDQYAAECAREVARELGLFEKLGHGPRALSAVYEELGIARQGRALLNRVIQILSHYGRGKTEGGVAELFANSPIFDRAELRRRGLAAEPRLAPAFAMADKVVEQARPFCRGETDDNSVRAKVHVDFFLECPVGVQCSQLGGVVVREFVEQAGGPIDLLELGGGTTSGATGILGALAEKDLLSKVNSYRFTELNPFFVMDASKKLPDRYGGVRAWDFLFIDFDRSLEDQGLKEESTDLAYSVNALHCAKDLLFTLKNTAAVLRSGGKLLIAQFTRSNEQTPLPFVDFVCDPLASYWDVKLDPKLRPQHGIHSFGVWKNALEQAGFRSVQVFPEVASGLNSFDKKYFLGVVIATKP